MICAGPKCSRLLQLLGVFLPTHCTEAMITKTEPGTISCQSLKLQVFNAPHRLQAPRGSGCLHRSFSLRGDGDTQPWAPHLSAGCHQQWAID